MRTDTRHYTTQLRPSSQHHRALQMLALGDACSSALRANCQIGHKLPDLPNFRKRILQTLRDREMIVSVARDTWRITPRGIQTLHTLAGTPEPAAQSAPPMRARASVFEPPALQLPDGVDRSMLTSSPVRSMTETDKRPAPVRREGLDFHQHPSRRGDRLYYRNGLVTDLDGNRLEVHA